MTPETTRCEGYSFRLINIDCIRDSTNFNIVMDLDRSVEDLLPYLAARLPGCTYTHGTGVINFMDAGHIVGIYPDRITVTDVSGIDEAGGLCAKYFGLIREVEANRSSIAPALRKRTTVSVMDILRALPGTNCGLCRYPTCMAFAACVFRREASIAECGPLSADLDGCRELLDQLRENGYPVP